MKKETVRSPWISFLALLFSTFVVIEAAAFQVPALPYIINSFGIPMAYAGSITVCYYAAGIVFAPIMGKVGDQIGRKKLMLIGLSIFAISEFLAAFSTTFSIFLFARFIQGVGYACIFPTMLAFVRDLFPPEKRGFPIGVLGAVGSLGAASGGIISGLLIDSLGWNSIYWVTSIFAIFGIIIVTLLIPNLQTGRNKVQIDYLGSFVLLITIVSIVTLPIQFSTIGSGSWITIGSILLAIAGIISLIFIEKRAKEPILDFKVLKIPAVYITCISAVLLTFSQISLTYALSFFIAAVPGYTAVQVGLVSTFNYLMGSISNPLIGFLNDKWRPQLFVVFGIAMLGISALLYSTIQVGTAMWFILSVSSLISFSLGTAQTSFKTIIVQNVTSDNIGAGTGMFSMFRDFGIPLGSTFSLALYASQKNAKVEATVEQRVTDLGIDSSYTNEIITAINSSSTEISTGLAAELQLLGLEANTFFQEVNFVGMSGAMTNVGLITGGAVGVCFIFCLFLFKKPKQHQASSFSQETPAVSTQEM